MKIKRLASTLAIAGGMMLTMAAAQAVIVSFDVPANLPSGGSHQASGSYHVVLNIVGNSVSATITGNNDGDAFKHSADKVSIGFFDGSGNLVHVAANVTPGASTAGGTSTAGTWAGQPIAGNATADWSTPDNPGGGPNIDPKGANQFTAAWTVQSADLELISVSLQDGTQQWSFTGQIVPEASSAALLLPGLLPIGIALRRRRAAKA